MENLAKILNIHKKTLTKRSFCIKILLEKSNFSRLKPPKPYVIPDVYV